MSALRVLFVVALAIGVLGQAPLHGQSPASKPAAEISGEALPSGARGRVGTYRQRIPEGATVSPKGTHYALIVDGRLEIGEISSGNCRRLELGKRLATQVTFAPDGRLLLLHDIADHIVRLVEVPNGKLVQEARLPLAKDKPPDSLQIMFAADGRSVAVAWPASGGQSRAWV